MDRTISKAVQGFQTVDGAGVHLVRVLGGDTVQDFDPILMLDSFDSCNPDDYTAGFPMHPHRGIETISYVVSGTMRHKDSLGNTDDIHDGEVQWMTAGAGILHEELIPAAPRLLGVQLWLNLPAKEKMIPSSYRSIRRENIPEKVFSGGLIRILSGTYNGISGYQPAHLPLDYYDIHLDPGAEFRMDTEQERSVMLFTLQGEVSVGGRRIPEKTAVHLTEGTALTMKNGSSPACVLFMSSRALREPVCWGGPIVMNTQEELNQAFSDLDSGSFLKNEVDYQ